MANANYNIRAIIGLQDNFSRPSRNVESSARNMAIGLGVTAAAAYGLKKAVDLSVDSAKKFATFEYGMSAVQAVTNATTADMEKLKDSALDLASGTKFKPEEVTSAMKFLGLAGYDTNEILQATPALLDLATASGGDLATTTDILSDNLTALGLKVSETGKLTDIFAKTATSSNTSVLQLGEAMSYAGLDAKNFGLSTEQTAAALGIMANNGIKASRGGTALRGILTRLIKPSKEAADKMKELGLSVDQDGKIKDFTQLLGETQVALSGLDQAERRRTVALLFGQVASSGANALLDTSIEKYSDFVTSLENSDGAAKKMATTMENNLTGSVTKLQSAVDVFQVKMGAAFGEETKEAVDILTEIVAESTEVMAESMGNAAGSFVDFGITVVETALMTTRKTNAMFDELEERADNFAKRTNAVDEKLEVWRNKLGFEGSSAVREELYQGGLSESEKQQKFRSESRKTSDILRFGLNRRKEETFEKFGGKNQAFQGLSQNLAIPTIALKDAFPSTFDVEGTRKRAISTQVDKLMDINIQSLSIKGGSIEDIVNNPQLIYEVGSQVMGELAKQVENSKAIPITAD